MFFNEFLVVFFATNSEYLKSFEFDYTARNTRTDLTEDDVEEFSPEQDYINMGMASLEIAQKSESDNISAIQR